MRVFKKRVLLSKQPWINKRKRERSSRHERSQTKHIPIDLTLEILSRLPAESVVRFRCVSKQWSSITRLPSFINSFASRSSTRRPRLLVTFSIGYNQYGISFPQHQNPDHGSYPRFYIFQITKPYFLNGCAMSKSVEGLILTGLDILEIWNPTLRRFSSLPLPHENYVGTIKQNCYKCYLGYDPLEGKHKVLYTEYDKYSEEVRVITLGAQESWRIITTGIPMHCPRAGRGKYCFSGVVYYKAHLLGDDHDIIMSFDINSESFKPITYPDGRSHWRFDLIPYEGRIALVTYNFALNNVDLYILKDADGREWTHQRFLDVRCNSKWTNLLYFEGTTDDGELVFASSSLSCSYYILYFDPRRNSVREAMFEGIVGEIRRCFGIDNKSMHVNDVFPNHIESLVSL